MEDEQIRGAAREIVADVLELDGEEVDDGARFSELGADSIQQLQIIAALRSRFGIRYSLSEESRLGSVDDAVEITRAHLRR